MPGKHRPRRCDAGHLFYADDTETKTGCHAGTHCLVQVLIETTKVRVKKTFCSIEHFKQWTATPKPEREAQTSAAVPETMTKEEFLRLALATYDELCEYPRPRDMYITKLAKALSQKTGLAIPQVYTKLAELNVWETLDGQQILVALSQGIFTKPTDLRLPNGKGYALIRIERVGRRNRTKHDPTRTILRKHADCV